MSANDVWAVGVYSIYDKNSFGGSSLLPSRTLVEHWNGKSWSVAPSPSLGTNDNNFYGVAAVSANDVWAVGYYGTSQTLIEHWDGKSWSVVSSPNVGTSNNYPRGVAAVSANDVWAVGYYDNGASQTFVEHWNGKSWSEVPMPSPNQ